MPFLLFSNLQNRDGFSQHQQVQQLVCIYQNMGHTSEDKGHTF